MSRVSPALALLEFLQLPQQVMALLPIKNWSPLDFSVAVAEQAILVERRGRSRGRGGELCTADEQTAHQQEHCGLCLWMVAPTRCGVRTGQGSSHHELAGENWPIQLKVSGCDTRLRKPAIERAFPGIYLASD